jgi:hypothetical protein
MENKYGTQTEEHNLRPRMPRNYSHLHTTLEVIAMTQHSVKRGLKVFGNRGTQAELKELRQLHDRKVLEPKGQNEMTGQERHNSFRYLMFLKETCYGAIKGRGYVDGRKQSEYTPKEETSSPMVAIKSLMLSCIINAKEGRDVAAANIPGAFMFA